MQAISNNQSYENVEASSAVLLNRNLSNAQRPNNGRNAAQTEFNSSFPYEENLPAAAIGQGGASRQANRRNTQTQDQPAAREGVHVALDRARTVGRMQTILPDRHNDSSDEEQKQEPRARPSAYDLLQERRGQVMHSGMDEDIENEIS